MSSLGHRTEGHWFESIAAFLGPAYLKYSFTKGTAQEVSALIELLDLKPGQRVLDVGCGPGRHALALAAAGLEVVGIDISSSFIDLATAEAERLGVAHRATFRVADARTLDFEGEFDVVISLCQGAFGLSSGPGVDQPLDRELDEPIVATMARALRTEGILALSAFSAYFQLRYLEDQDAFDADQGVNHESTTVRNEVGEERAAELWTTCYTPRELRWLARQAGLTVVAVFGVTPGGYGRGPASIDCPEFMLIARRHHG